MKKYIIITLIIIFQSCNILEINESGYRSLLYLEKLHIKPFESADLDKSCEDSNCLTIFEINSENIKNLLSQQEYTWVHVWNPFCSNESCINIDQFEKLENNYKSNGLKLFFISSSYDFDQIVFTVKKSRFSKPIYVLEGSYYGPKLKKIRQKLYKDLNSNSKSGDYFFYDNFLFKGDSLIFMGNEVNDSIFDNLIIKTTANKS